ncbi:Predicted heme/steroid binding protein [Maledivibacter halophilus]|uniref:Predicted heme/steroid binding protein n=1 Tax=Maledivibacter halophilus TaxID=36842 RepID=A0A1T5L9B7_9FIRM|nr:Predicted heme/steroid binding protein [Maledivibacter halophilus]
MNKLKNEREINFKINKTKENINYFKKMIRFTIHPYQKQYYNQLLIQEMRRLTQLMTNLNNTNTREVRKFTMEELKENNGSGGKPAYIAVNGIVYDVSSEATWGGGTHFGIYAGTDATKEFARCHGGSEILKKLPKIGILK